MRRRRENPAQSTPDKLCRQPPVHGCRDAARTRRLALGAGLLALMAAGSAAPGLRTVETEEVDAAEWAALEQAMAMAGATGNTTGADNSTGAGGAVASASAAAGVGDLEDCIIGEGCSRRGKRRRSEEERKLTPLELCASRGRRFVFVTEICSQVRACSRRSLPLNPDTLNR